MRKPLAAVAALAAAIALVAAPASHAAPLATSFTLTIYEQTGSINANTFQSSDQRLYSKRVCDPGPVDLGYCGFDFGTGGCEYYDIFFSDASGNVLTLSPEDPLPYPVYLTIICMDLNCNNGLPDPAPTWVGAGNNLDAVKIAFTDSVYWAVEVMQAQYGLCDEPFSAKTSNFADAALGPQDGAITKMGCGFSSLTLRLGSQPPAPPAGGPAITSIRDVGGDQGGMARIKWLASGYDSVGSQKPITAYAIWRRIDANFLASGDPLLMYPPGEWDYVVSVPACCEKTYSTLVPTLGDSTIADGMHYSVFFVRALTATPGDYLDSPVDSGYSVDNLPPLEPTGMRGMQVANGLRIAWEPSVESDFHHYLLFKGTCSNDPAPSLFATLTGTSCVDEAWTPEDSRYYYTLRAVDRSGNASSCAELAPSVIVATLLQGFSLKAIGQTVELAWRLSQCEENVEFIISRAEGAGSEFERLTAARPSRSGLDFVYRDAACLPGTAYRYRVEYSDGSRASELFETEQIVAPAAPLTLYQNQPNPFNPSTTIRYYLPERMRVLLEIYDASGRLVARLVNDEQERGDKAVRWDGRGMRGDAVSSGVYYYRLQAGKEAVSRTMVLLK